MIWALMTMLAADIYLEDEQEDIINIEIVLEDTNAQAN